MKTGAERIKAHRERKRQAGLIEVRTHVKTPEQKQKLLAMAEEMRK